MIKLHVLDYYQHVHSSQVVPLVLQKHVLILAHNQDFQHHLQIAMVG
jgi:hypothetical protein